MIPQDAKFIMFHDFTNYPTTKYDICISWYDKNWMACSVNNNFPHFSDFMFDLLVNFKMVSVVYEGSYEFERSQK